MLPSVLPRVAMIKRLLDVAGSVVGLGLTVPLYIPISIAIVADSPGPVFYVQRRAGRLIEEGEGGYHWVEFDMIKFRTMRNDAEKGTGAVVSTQGDPRITRVGRFLRSTRLDEIP